MPGGVYIRRWQLDMTPKTKANHVRQPSVPPDRHGDHRGGRRAGGCANKPDKQEDRMTLCGSEVPQDRWRGRTAGSGMWTLTRDNLLSWSLDDPAITYG